MFFIEKNIFCGSFPKYLYNYSKFLLFYGQDVLYSYFLDLNGDGHINHEKELIGQVLQRTTFDKKTALEAVKKSIKE